LQVHRARHQDQPRQRQPVVEQLVGQRRAAGGAVAFAGQVERRAEAAVGGQPAAQYLGQRLDVAVDRELSLARRVVGAD
jgi:hypothetical protein